MRKLLSSLVMSGLAAAAYPTLHAYLAPCAQPITWSIGAIDKRFNVGQAMVERAAEDAAALWELRTGRDLFRQDAQGSVPIHLVYDERQEAGVILRAIGLKVDDSKKSYEALEAAYGIAQAQFDAEEAAYRAMRDAYGKRRKAYEEEVRRARLAGGVSPQEADRLERERLAVNAEARALNGKQAYVNQLADRVNAMVVRLNALVPEINAEIDRFNTVGAARGDEFDAGEYLRDVHGQRINVYVVEDQEQLTRILAHELGHALGLGHVEDPKAIMYRLNLEKKLVLTDSDIAALDERCGL